MASGKRTKKQRIPHFAIGQGELNDKPDVPKEGARIRCSRCGKMHKVQYSERLLENGQKVKSNTLTFVECGKTTYLIGVAGKRIWS